MEPVPHRLELKQLEDGTVFIDDAYSSNTTGFEEGLNLLNSLEGTRILATPGIVELGKATREIHLKLGAMAGKSCDHIFLIGKNDRTQALFDGVENKSKVKFLTTINELFPTVRVLHLPRPIVLIENDLPDNY
jgi:UDP-N-acetylmuramoyl-tripeptide--D-alanyl-D-alanine ligase